MDWQAFLAHPVTKGAITGFLTAAVVDYAAFRSWKSFNDFFTYDWKLAAFRWSQGTLSGAIAAAGLDRFVG